MKIYTLHTKQNLPISLQEAWDFLSSPKNLKTITPDYMGFNILSGAEKPIYCYSGFGDSNKMGDRDNPCSRQKIFCR